MTTLRRLFAVFATAASFAASAQDAPPKPTRPPIEQILAGIGVDAERATKATAILDAGHVKAEAARRQIGRPTDDTGRATMKAAMDAIRQDTDAKLAQVLSADELARLREAMPPPHRRPR